MLDTMSPESVPHQPPAAPSVRQSSKVRDAIKAIAVAGAVMLLAEILRVFVGTNFNTVVPGKCYRSAQPNAHFLAVAQRDYGIRSIINLRDENVGEPWYEEEKRAAERLGIQLFNAGLSTKEQPPTDDFHRFVQAMKDAPEPILIHCANGNDRSGLASAVYLMMRTDTPMPEARRQLSLRYGHIPGTKASCLSRLLDSYEAWLHDHSWQHSPDRFYQWGMTDYREEVLEQ